MQKWIISPAPCSEDPARQLLLFQGDVTDVVTLVRRFGPLCGRPERAENAGEFNFKMFLHKTAPADLEKMTAFLTEIAAKTAPAGAASPVPPPPAAAAPAAPAPAPPEIPEIPAITPAAAPPDPTPAAAPPDPTPVAESVPAPAAAEPAAPSVPAPVPEVPASPPPPEPAALAPAETPAPRRGEPKPNWAVEIGLDGKRNFDALVVGSFNRFAHAASASVVGAPGTMYNPLFLHGAPGVGKTHMLHAIGSGLGKPLGLESILMTSGPRLALGVDLALAEGRLPDLEGWIGQKKALLLDDIHLIAVSDANQAALAKIFESFFNRGLQVVISSLYPPKALGSLEDALKISFAKGWSVDMKVPGVDVQKDMLLQAFARMGWDLTNDENAVFHEKLGVRYADSLRWARRLTALKKIREGGEGSSFEKLIASVFPEGAVDGEFPSGDELSAAGKFSPPAADDSARSIAVLHPRGQELLAPWVASQLYKAQSELGFTQTFRTVLTHAYDADQPFGVPFQIGTACRKAGAEAALIIGPSSTSKLSERAAEFAHAVIHILEASDVAVGWIPHSGTKAAIHSRGAALDFQAHWRLP